MGCQSCDYATNTDHGRICRIPSRRLRVRRQRHSLVSILGRVAINGTALLVFKSINDSYKRDMRTKAFAIESPLKSTMEESSNNKPTVEVVKEIPEDAAIK